MIFDHTEYLFHYTSAEGLYGIFKDQSVWATDIRYFNDPEELHFSSKLVLSFFVKALEGHPDRSLILEILEYELSVKSYPCVFSLTEDGDSWNHWQNYCNGSGGFAIGFKKSKIDEICKEHHYDLKRCLYDTESQLSLLEPVCDSALQSLKKNDHKSDPDIIAAICNTLCENIINIEPVIRNSSFKEEKEWRVISHADITDFRVLREIFTPFAKLPFYLPPDKTPLLSNWECIGEWLSGIIVVGPSAKQKLNQIAVDEFLGKCRSWNVVLSEVSPPNM